LRINTEAGGRRMIRIPSYWCWTAEILENFLSEERYNVYFKDFFGKYWREVIEELYLYSNDIFGRISAHPEWTPSQRADVIHNQTVRQCILLYEIVAAFNKIQNTVV
jgi:hypothetical protein